MRRHTVAHLAWAAALWTAVAAMPLRAEWVSRTEDGIMGTRISVELWAPERAGGEAAIADVFADMRRIDALMSTYKPDSLVSRVNAQAAAMPVVVEAELFALLATAVDYSRLTDGAFDITYASVGFLYDFRARQRPDAEAIAAALPGVNYRHLLLDATASSVRFARDGVRIDLGGIAKGHAVDSGIRILRGHGIAHALISAGGDSRIIGDRFGKPWIIGIRHPDRPDEVIVRMPLIDAAMSTSGDYERYFDDGGERYHHIIDPRSGRSASLVRSATVIAATATRTDGLSKTAFVLGPERALAIYNALGDVDAVLVTPDGRVLYTQGLEPPTQ